jgi:prolipoprotein diacylglyceryltransferase
MAGAAMHPSFLYESAFLALCAWVLFVIARRRDLPAPWMVEGDVFKLFLLVYAVFRFFVEIVRGNPIMGFGLTGSQLIVLPSAVVLTLYFVRRQRLYAAAPLAPLSMHT